MAIFRDKLSLDLHPKKIEVFTVFLRKGAIFYENPFFLKALRTPEIRAL